jgi:arsenate reductase
MKFYAYRKCSTCRDAAKWLASRGLEVESLEIRETPPTCDELQYALTLLGEIRKLLNTSGAEYRAMGLKDRLGDLASDEIFMLIQENGNLCKRPFLIDEEKGIVLTGFNAEEWERGLQGT